MSKSKKFLAIGIWTVILPYLGFPLGIKNLLFVVTGLLIIYMSYRMFLESKVAGTEKKTFDNFSENDNFDKKI